MDHFSAHIILFANTAHMPQTITSGLTIPDSEMALKKRTSAMLSIRQQQETAYHNDIASALRESDEVVLFGPTDAKKELFKMLRKDQHFDSTSIEIYNSYKMTGSQEYEHEENCISGQGEELEMRHA